MIHKFEENPSNCEDLMQNLTKAVHDLTKFANDAMEESTPGWNTYPEFSRERSVELQKLSVRGAEFLLECQEVLG